MTQIPKWCYVRVSKCASTTIRAHLGEVSHPSMRVPHIHATAAEIIAANPQQFGPKASGPRPLLFSFIRNPWDRVLSLYAMRTRAEPDGASFESWVCKHPIGDKGFAYSYRSMLCDPRGRLLVGWVGRYEELHYAYRDIASRLVRVRETELTEGVWKNRGKRGRDYRDYYTPRARDRVAERLAWDIERFGYVF